MIEDVRRALKEEIGKLITAINNSRNEAPEPELKYLRKFLLRTKREIFTIDRQALKNRLEYFFIRLGNVDSKSDNLAQAYAIASKLHKTF